MSPYAAAVRLYPRAFRQEYGDDMVALAEEMRRELGRPRAAVRLACDLLVSLPARYLEVLVKRPAPILFPSLALGVSAVLVTMAVVVGTAAGVGLVVIAMLAGSVAVLALPHARAVREHTVTGHWWQLLLVGFALHGLVIAGQLLAGDSDSELLWPLAVVGVLGGWMCLGTGVVLGLVHLVRRRPAAT